MRRHHTADFHLPLWQAEVEPDAADSLQDFVDQRANGLPRLRGESTYIRVIDARITVQEPLNLRQSSSSVSIRAARAIAWAEDGESVCGGSFS